MAEPLAVAGTGYEVVEEEPPEVLGRNLISAGYLMAGATAFFFVAFLFAFFYLRALNNGAMWKPSGVDASVGWGTAVVACYAELVDVVGGDLGSGFALVRPDGILAARGSARDAHHVVDYLCRLCRRSEPEPAAAAPLSQLVAP